MAKAVVSVITASAPFSLVSYSVVRDSRSGYLAKIRLPTMMSCSSIVSPEARSTMDIVSGTVAFQYV